MGTEENRGKENFVVIRHLFPSAGGVVRTWSVPPFRGSTGLAVATSHHRLASLDTYSDASEKSLISEPILIFKKGCHALRINLLFYNENNWMPTIKPEDSGKSESVLIFSII